MGRNGAIDRMVKRDIEGCINMFKIHGIKFHVLIKKINKILIKKAKPLNLKTAIKMDNIAFRFLILLLYFYIS